MEASETRGPHVRTDRVHSDIVDKGVALQDRLGTLCALEFMKSHSIDAAIIQRVLLSPSQRRKVS